MKSYLLLVFILIIPKLVWSTSIEIGAWIIPNAAPDIKKEQYIMVDFWATWCGPCLKAMDHMSELKKTTGEKVIYLSITNENQTLIQQLFKNREAKTFIVTDYKNRTFDKYKIESLPYSVLIAPDGSIVWEGMPSDMNFKLLNEFINTKRKVATNIDKKIITHHEEQKVKTEDLGQEFRMNEITSRFLLANDDIAHNVVNDCNSSKFSGRYSEIIASILQIPNHNIIIKPEFNRSGYFSVDTCLVSSNRGTVINLFMQTINSEYTIHREEKDIYECSVLDSTLLWDSQMYEWNENFSPSFIAGEGYFQADNFSIKDLVLQLSNIFQKEITYFGSYTKIHDWNINYQSFENLQMMLKDEYGISIEKKQSYTKKYLISEKGNK